MKEFEKIEDKLYYATYCNRGSENPKEIWNSIKDNEELLKWAIKPVKDKFGERYLVNGLAICEDILIDYKNVNKDIYRNLVNLIYSNREIARLVIDGYGNGGYSYLLMTLWNPNLELTEEQKAFAVDEAMNKIGTVRSESAKNEYSLKLDMDGITDDETMCIEFGGSINPVGLKTGSMYMFNLSNSLSDTQAHGDGYFDIRYWILRNPNWSIEEKQKLVMDFWYNDNEYDIFLEEWEWGIINERANYKGHSMPLLDKEDLFDYSYDSLFKFYGDKETTDEIWDKIEFCKLMHKLRPEQWELEFMEPKVYEKEMQNY